MTKEARKAKDNMEEDGGKGEKRGRDRVECKNFVMALRTMRPEEHR